MSSADQVAADLEAANAEAIAFAESCSPREWETIVPGEEWPVALVLHHIAEGHELLDGWLDRLRKGQAVAHTRNDIDDRNALHASDYAGVSIEATIELLQSTCATTAATIRSLSDEELERSAPFGPANGRDVTTAQIAGVATTHVRTHLEHAATALRRD